LATQQLLAMVPEPKALVHGSQIWPAAPTVQAKKTQAFLPRQPDCMAEERAGEPLSLAHWEYCKFVQVCKLSSVLQDKHYVFYSCYRIILMRKRLN
jgi:hypothetical protein